MFQTGIFSRVAGYTTSGGAISKVAPDGSLIAEFTLGVGGGSDKYPVMWVHVAVWEKVAEEVLKVFDRKGIAVEVSGMLQVSQYPSKRGGTGIAVDLKNVRELKICDRDGNLVKELSGVKAE
jgi:single-stranded DNA-binding protein